MRLNALSNGNCEIGEIDEIDECPNNEMSGYQSNEMSDCYENNEH